MAYNEHKMRVMTGPQPSDEEMEELFAEAAALEMALDEVEDDEREEAELGRAYKEVMSKIRLNFYRSGLNPVDRMTEI